MSALARGIAPAHRTTDQLFASLHERLAGTRGVHELYDIERRMKSQRGAFCPPEVYSSIVALMNYSWQDEARDHEEMTAAGEDTTGHVFEHLQRIEAWVNPSA